MATPTQRDHETAFHEAAHVVARIVMFQDFVSVDIHQTDERHGYIACDGRRLTPLSAAAVTIAGLVSLPAEALLHPDWDYCDVTFTYCEDDICDSETVCESLGVELRKAEQIARQLFTKYKSAIKAVANVLAERRCLSYDEALEIPAIAKLMARSERFPKYAERLLVTTKRPELAPFAYVANMALA